MVRAAARSAQYHPRGCDHQRSGTVKYARGELYGAAKAVAIKRTCRDGIDSVLNRDRVVGSGGRDIDLRRDCGKSDAAGPVACERVVRNCDAILIAKVCEASIRVGMDPFALLGKQSVSED